MGDGGFSVDPAPTLIYIEGRIRHLFGKDPESQEWKRKIAAHVAKSAEQASTVQTIGMQRAIPLGEIYQTARLNHAGPDPIEDRDLLRRESNALVFAGPGGGKTTLLRWLYLTACAQRDFRFPLLFTLSLHEAVDDLDHFIGRLAASGEGKNKYLLLIDGYDEISEEKKKRVSAALLVFSGLRLGNFILSCREHYHVFELHADRFSVQQFDRLRALRFLEAFLRVYESPTNPGDILDELEAHHLETFAFHPLMLALVAYVKTGPDKMLPGTTIGLLGRALDLLTSKWDAEKGVHRETAFPDLDGFERLRILMRIAYRTHDLKESYHLVHQAIEEHLSSRHITGVTSTNTLLTELSQWYGILTEVDATTWEFSHDTFKAYLGARFMVEGGKFSSNSTPNWDLRTVYATCLLVDDATDVMAKIAKLAPTGYFLKECLYNRPSFRSSPLASGLIERITRTPSNFRLIAGEGSIEASIIPSEDFFLSAPTDLLEDIAGKCFNRRDEGAAVLALCSIAEIKSRGKKPPALYHSNNPILTACFFGQPCRIRVRIDKRILDLTDSALVP